MFSLMCSEAEDKHTANIIQALRVVCDRVEPEPFPRYCNISLVPVKYLPERPRSSSQGGYSIHRKAFIYGGLIAA